MLDPLRRGFPIGPRHLRYARLTYSRYLGGFGAGGILSARNTVVFSTILPLTLSPRVGGQSSEDYDVVGTAKKVVGWSPIC